MDAFSRRERSDNSTTSATPSFVENADAAATFDETFRFFHLGEQETPVQTLKRMLSTTSAHSTPSTLAQNEQQAALVGSKVFKHIGKGTCAEIFSQPGAEKILKRAFPGWEADLSNDYKVHLILYHSFMNPSIDLDILVPKCYEYVRPDTESFWREYGQEENAGFPEQYQTAERRQVLVTQRIFPLHKAIRTALINTFCAESSRAEAASNPDNADCLARLYLGSRNLPAGSAPFSLRNFELTLGRIRMLGLDEFRYVRSIAQGLALLHWGVKVDARDVEFVLGAAPTKMPVRLSDLEQLGAIMGTRDIWEFKKREVHVWVLDFNQCRAITMDEAGCEMAARAHWDNDPYYPRPDVADETELWETFASEYKKVGAALLREASDLPAKYIRAVEVECERRYPNGPPSTAPPHAAPRPPSSASPASSASRSRHQHKGPKRGNVDLDALKA